MILDVFLAAAVLLALERIAYAVIWHRPDVYARLLRVLDSDRDPVSVLASLFGAFKLLQVLVFLWWCVAHGDGPQRQTADAPPLVAGALLLVAGQTLNLSVFARLGRTGVFYGNRFGHQVAWCQGFPFSVCRHPQYAGAVLSIWGLFIAVRYPAPDWLALPLLETAYYLIGALVEQAPESPAPDAPHGARSAAAGPPAAGHPR